MNSLFHKIMSMLMALVVLFSTMSFTVDMHYCGDTMVDFAFFQTAESCGMEKVQVAPTSENTSISQKSCCSEEQLVIEGQDDLKNAFNNLTFEQQVFVAAFTYFYLNLFEGTDYKEVSSVDSASPYVKRNLQVLHQAFLI